MNQIKIDNECKNALNAQDLPEGKVFRKCPHCGRDVVMTTKKSEAETSPYIRANGEVPEPEHEVKIYNADYVDDLKSALYEVDRALSTEWRKSPMSQKAIDTLTDKKHAIEERLKA